MSRTRNPRAVAAQLIAEAGRVQRLLSAEWSRPWREWIRGGGKGGFGHWQTLPADRQPENNAESWERLSFSARTLRDLADQIEALAIKHREICERADEAKKAGPK